MKAIPMKLNLKKASLVLQAARKIIRNEERWTEGALARDQDGNDCGTKSKQAVAFCALGAVTRINGPAQKSAVAFLREAARTVFNADMICKEVGPANTQDIFNVNDDMGHKDTLKMFALAIRRAKKAGK